MATSIPTSPKRGPRVRESAREGEIGRDAQYDLLTAALIGAAIGAIIFGMVRQGIVYAGVDADWFQVFLGGMVLFAVMLNQFVRRRAMGVR